MKKTLIALATLAAGGSAMAQSSVTLYGILDVGVRNDSAFAANAAGNGSVSKLSVESGVLNTSRWGMRGSEDLGGGLRANFNVESGLNAATGSQGNSAALFDRRAAVGISGGFGRVDLGRNTTLTYDMTAAYVTDPLGNELSNQNIGAYKKALPINPVNLLSGTSSIATVRRDNVIKYVGTFGAVSAGVAYSVGGVPGDSGVNNSLQGMLRYKDSAADAAVAYDNLKDAKGRGQTVVTVGGNYKFGAFTPTLGYTMLTADAGFAAQSAPTGSTTNYAPLTTSSYSQIYTYITGGSATTTGMKAAVTAAGLGYDFSSAVNVVGAYYRTQFSGDSLSTESYDTYVVRAKYAFSKNTFAYGVLDYTSAGIAASATAAKSTSATGITVGLQTRF